MNFLISSAMAQSGDAAPGGNFLIQLAPLLLIIVIFYFLLIRPQQKRAKEHRAMVEGLTRGDEVVTNGGLLGKVTDVGETFLTLEISDNVRIRVQKHAIGTVMPKGTMKSA